MNSIDMFFCEKDKSREADKYIPMEYTLNESGKYVKIPADGFEPENIALKQVWESINERIENTRKRVILGELSPLAYYMEKNQMDIKKISFITGLPKRKIKKHLIPDVFRKLDSDILNLYARVFEISAERIFQIH